MFRITLLIALYGAFIASTSGFVAESAENVTDSKEVEIAAESVDDVPIVSSAALTSNFVNSKQFFLVTTEKANWYRAAHICRVNGMDLASIDSMEEHNIIVMLINMSGCGGISDLFWTSGNDLGAFREWFWLSNGKPMSFTNWGSGEPNNYNNINERCVEIRYINNAWSWNDRPCGVESFFICETRFN